MKPKVREARDRLLKALAALEDPKVYCAQNEYGNVKDLENARVYAAGAAKVLIEFALQDLGEPIDPYRPHEAGPYVRSQ